jgi:NAD(P)-dependent dehydrogenase (short-subunit alcohol dehydrogenase family)
LLVPGLFDMTGKVALITGASDGLGRHFARTLAAAGATVVLGARRAAKLDEAAAEIEQRGGAAIPVIIDVTSEASVAKAFCEIGSRAGMVNVVVNNAGVTVTKSLLDMTESEWDGVIDTNLKGAWFVTREAARHLIAAKRPGTIVNISSILGERVAGNLAAYTASKAGLTQLTKASALELARYQIRVNALAPGYILSSLNEDFFASPAGEAVIKRIPQRRLGELADLDGPLLLLASDASPFLTGAVLSVDGGHLVSSL